MLTMTCGMGCVTQYFVLLTRSRNVCVRMVLKSDSLHTNDEFFLGCSQTESTCGVAEL